MGRNSYESDEAIALIRSRRGGRPNNQRLACTDLTHSRKEMAKGFSLTIRADDGSTMLQTNVDYIHQAFQRLIDWSIGAVDQDVCAVISGPKGFYANNRIKALTGFLLDRR